MQSTSLTSWIFEYLNHIPEQPLFFVKATIEAATGLLQNVSLKSTGMEKIIHSQTPPLPTLNSLLASTSLNADQPDDTLTLMAATYILSVIYQIVTRKQGKQMARQISFA